MTSEIIIAVLHGLSNDGVLANVYFYYCCYEFGVCCEQCMYVYLCTRYHPISGFCGIAKLANLR